MALVERVGSVLPVEGACRASVLFRFVDGGEVVQRRESGWAVTEPGWLRFLADEEDGWVSWPAGSVVCVEWAARDA